MTKPILGVVAAHAVVALAERGYTARQHPELGIGLVIEVDLDLDDLPSVRYSLDEPMLLGLDTHEAEGASVAERIANDLFEIKRGRRAWQFQYIVTVHSYSEDGAEGKAHREVAADPRAHLLDAGEPMDMTHVTLDVPPPLPAGV